MKGPSSKKVISYLLDIREIELTMAQEGITNEKICESDSCNESSKKVILAYGDNRT